MSQPATVRLINQLVESGHATRTAHEQDGRRVRLRLTDEGVVLAREVLRARADVTDRVFEALNPREQAQLSRLLTKAFHAMSPSPTMAEHICRLCDIDVCLAVNCPIHEATKS